MPESEAYGYWVDNTVSLPALGNGPLNGKRLAVKDLFAISGRVSSFGLAEWRNSHQPSRSDAPSIRVLRRAGASIAGLTKLDQFAFSLVGNVAEGAAPMNPRYAARFTGGSSSGCAAAVAANEADLGIGTDTAGSIRVPAAACGLYGLRPTHASVSTAGVLPLAPSFDVPGILARDVRTLIECFTVWSPAPTADHTIRHVVHDEYAGLHPDVTLCVRAVADLIAERLHVPVIPIDFTALANDDVADLFSRIQTREIWDRHSAWVTANRRHFASDVDERLQRGKRLAAAPLADRRRDAQDRIAYRRSVFTLHPRGTVAVGPVLQHLAPMRDATDHDLKEFRTSTLRLTACSSLAGTPQAVVPVLHQRSGNTYGVGVSGLPLDDHLLLGVVALIAPKGDTPLPI